MPRKGKNMTDDAETTETAETADPTAEAAPTGPQERSHEESAPRHEPTACACPSCDPQHTEASPLAMPVHQCQRCFLGVCCALDGAEPRLTGGWVKAQEDSGLFDKETEEAE